MNISRRIARNTCTGLIAKSIEVIAAFVTLPLLLGALGKENYGFWITCSQVLVLFATFDLGVASSIGKFVAKYNARSDIHGLTKNLSTSFFLLSLSTVVVFISTLIIALNFIRFFDVAPERVTTGIRIILILGIGIAVDLVLRIGRGILAGLHSFHLIYIVNTGKTLYRLALILVFYYILKSESVMFIAMIAVSAMLLSDIVMCLVARRKERSVRIRFKEFTRSSVKEILSLSSASMLGGLVVTFTKSATLLIIANKLSLEKVTLYSIPMSLIVYLTMIISTFMISFTPLASQIHELRDEDRIKRLNMLGVRYSLTACLGFGLITIFLGRHFLALWFGDTVSLEECAMMSNVLSFLIIGFIFDRGQSTTAKMLLGADQQWLNFCITAAKNILGLSSGYVLVTYTSLGIIGMAIGWLIVYVVVGGFVYPLAACYCFKISVPTYFTRVYLRPVLVSAPLALLSCTLARYFNPASWLSLFIVAASCAGSYFFLIYFICLEKEHRVLLFKYVMNLRTAIS